MNHHWIWWNVFKVKSHQMKLPIYGKTNLNQWAWFFSHDKIPEGRTLPLSPMGAFLPCKKWKGKVNLLCLFFCFSKKVISECLRATQWKFDYSPSEKLLFSIWFHENFNYRVLLLLKRHERSSAIFAFAFAFWGLGLAPSKAQSRNFER